MSRIFISHSSADDHHALALREWLAEEGWSADSDVYLDIHPDSGMAAGQRWLNALEEAATRCEAVVFLVSETWLSSHWCSDEMRLAQTLNKKIFPLLIESIDLERLPHGLTAEWQVVRLHTEPMAETARRFRTNHPITNEPGTSYFATDGLQRLKHGLTKAGIGADSFELQADPDGPFGWRMPYRGLEPLQAEDAAVFFGRDADIVRGMDTLRGLVARQPPQMLVVLGASGSGKSSFLRAGLLPRLQRDDNAWLTFPPLRVADNGALDGDEGLLTALIDVHERFGEQVSRAELRTALSSSTAFIELLRTLRKKAASRVLIEDLDKAPLPLIAIDQAEELENADAQPEAGQLLELLRVAMESGELLLVSTIRSDSYDAMQNNEALNGVPQTPLSLAAIAPGEIAQIIRGPAEVLAAKAGPDAPRFSAEVVEKLQREMTDEPDALPLLAFALQRLVRDHSATPTIGLDQLALTGGVTIAIGAAANAALRDAGVSNDTKQRHALLRKLFVPRLARIDPQTHNVQRRVANLEQFKEPQLASLVDALVTRRLLVRKGGDRPTLEVAHESLLRRWPELVDVLFEDRESLLQLDVVQRAAVAWDKAVASDKSEFLVHRGQRLMAAKALLEREDFARELEGVGAQYLEVCEKAEIEAAARAAKQARIRKTLQIAVVSVVVLASVGAIFGWLMLADGRRNLQLSQRDLAAKTSNFLGVEAEQEYEAGRYDSAMRIALAAFNQEFDFIDPFTQWTLARSAHSSRLLADLRGHSGVVWQAAFSPDGARVVTASDDDTARVWSTDADGAWSSQELIGHNGFVRQAAFSPDGARVVTASRDQTARVWSADATGGWSSQVLTGHSSGINQAAFSPDGARVVTASKDTTARVWSADADGGWSAQVLAGHNKAVSQASFSPDGARVVTASSDQTARVWSADPTGAWSWQLLAGHTSAVHQAAFSPDGTRVVTASRDGTARVWSADAAGAWSAQVLAGHTSAVNQAAFSPDGTQVVTASRDGTARVWSADTDGVWSSQVLAGHTDEVNQAAFSPDAARVVTASGDNTARVWTADSAVTWSSQVLAGHTDAVNQAAFSPDGSRVVTASGDNTARVWSADAAGGWSSQELNGPKGPIRQTAFPPDGARVVTTARLGAVRVWTADAAGGWLSQVLAGHSGHVVQVVFSPDGSRVVTASRDQTARVWMADAAGGWSSQLLAGHNKTVSQAAFSLDGVRVVTASEDDTARVWSADADGAWSSPVLAGHTDAVNRAAFSPDGARVVTASRDQTARVWSADADGGWSAQVLAGHTDAVNLAAFSPDGVRVVTAADDTARVWSADATGGWSSKVLAGHTDEVIQALFSPDGTRVVTASRDQTARVWSADAAGDWSAQVLAGHTSAVNQASFSPDGARVVTASRDQTARVWSADADGGWSSQELAGHTNTVHQAAFSPDGARVVTASGDQTVRVWDVQWLTTRFTQENFVVQVCQEKLPRAARVITSEDIQRVPSLRGREGENVCAHFLKP